MSNVAPSCLLVPKFYVSIQLLLSRAQMCLTVMLNLGFLFKDKHEHESTNAMFFRLYAHSLQPLLSFCPWRSTTTIASFRPLPLSRTSLQLHHSRFFFAFFTLKNRRRRRRKHFTSGRICETGLRKSVGDRYHSETVCGSPSETDLTADSPSLSRSVVCRLGIL